MELSLIRDRLSYAENIFSETHTTEEAMEMIVPDALPDILRIVGADAMVFVRSKDTSQGRVTIGGVATVSVIYAPEGETGLRRVNLELPFQITAENARITPTSNATTRLIPGTVNAIALNPRKVSVRVNIAAEISCYDGSELEIPTAIAPEDCDCIEVLPGEMEVSLPVEVLEKTFVANYEYQIPPSNPPVGEILRTAVCLEPEDVKVVGSKLIFKGTTTVSVLYNGADSGEVTACSFDTEYSQILELENANSESEFEIIPLLTGAYIECDNMPDNEGRRLTAELHIAAQCVAHSKMKLCYINDAYSSKYELENTQSNLSLCGAPNIKSVPAVLRANVDAPDLSRVVSVNAKPGAPNSTLNGNELELSTPVDVEALYIANDGTVRTAAGKYNVETTIMNVDNAAGLKTSAKNSGDVYGAPSDGGIEVRIPLEVTAFETTKCECRHISEINLDEECPLDLASMPSLVIARVSPGENLWSLAKKHHSTCDLISNANELEDDTVLPKVLVIPKKR